MDHERGLEALSERYWQFLRHEFPLTAYSAGDPTDDPVMFREAPGEHDRRAESAGHMLAELRRIPAEGLSATARCTHRLLERELDDLRAGHAVWSHLRPWLLPGGPEFNAMYFADLVTLGDAGTAGRYVERLATLPRYFEDIGDCLVEGRARGIRHPRAVLTRWRGTLVGLAAASPEATAWYGPFRRSPAAQDPAVVAHAERARGIIAREILPSLARLAARVDAELLPDARDTVACTDAPLGLEYYTHWLRHFTTRPELTAESMHELGLSEVERLHRAIEAIAAEAGHAGDVAAYRRFLATDPQFLCADADSLRARAEGLAKRIDGRLPAYFGRLPRITYGIDSIPAAMSEAMPIGYAQPNPADGSRAGIYWLNSLPAKAPTWMLPAVSLHEAWPGHLMHLALLQEMHELPAFRRANFTRYTACLEGWAMYCEGLGVDMDVYRTPHEHFGRLDMELWRACRLVVDTGLHVRGWSRDRAIEYMASNLTMSRVAIEGEVDRYIAMPAQALAYQVGGLTFRALRARAASRLGSRFQLRRFHDAVLGAGAVTLPALEAHIEDWIATSAAA